jgi:hypothetical protein
MTPMAIDIPAIFTQLQEDVTKFVLDSKAWCNQITKDGKTTDPADLDALSQLELVETNLTKDVQNPAPKDQVALRDVFIAVDGHLTQAKDFYSVLVGVSQTPEAENKESAARKSLKLLIIEMNKIRPQVGGLAIVNLFLIVMESLVGKGPQKIGDITFPEVTKDEFELTERLFRRKRFRLDDEKIIGNLIGSWETVIAYFVEINKAPATSTSSTSSMDPDVKVTFEAKFFTMHGLLELLYDQLEANKRTTDILSPIL